MWLCKNNLWFKYKKNPCFQLFWFMQLNCGLDYLNLEPAGAALSPWVLSKWLLVFKIIMFLCLNVQQILICPLFLRVVTNYNYSAITFYYVDKLKKVTPEQFSSSSPEFLSTLFPGCWKPAFWRIFFLILALCDIIGGWISLSCHILQATSARA